MAYPTIDKPYGLRPVNLLGGRVYSGSTRQIAIASGEGTSIFYGDIVIMSSNGCITRATLTATTVNVAGIFLGCTYVNTQGQRIFSQYFPANTTGTLDSDNMILAYVADDPQIVMRMAVVSSGTTISGRARAAVGENAAWIDNAGSTVTGDSAIGLNSTTATTTTLPLRIVDVVPETKNASGSFTEFLVTWNPTIHMYTTSAGV